MAAMETHDRAHGARQHAEKVWTCGYCDAHPDHAPDELHVDELTDTLAAHVRDGETYVIECDICNGLIAELTP